MVYDAVGFLIGIKTSKPCRAAAVRSDKAFIVRVRDRVLLESWPAEKVMDQSECGACAKIRLACSGNSMIIHPGPGDAGQADVRGTEGSQAVHDNGITGF